MARPGVIYHSVGRERGKGSGARGAGGRGGERGGERKREDRHTQQTNHTAFDAVSLVAVVLANLPVCRGLHAALFAHAEWPLVRAERRTPVAALRT